MQRRVLQHMRLTRSVDRPGHSADTEAHVLHFCVDARLHGGQWHCSVQSLCCSSPATSGVLFRGDPASDPEHRCNVNQTTRTVWWMVVNRLLPSDLVCQSGCIRVITICRGPRLDCGL